MRCDESELAWTLIRFPGLRILDSVEDTAAGPGWHGLRWYVTREGQSARC